MTPQRIQFSRRRGARMPDGAVYVGRHVSPTYGRWGNPFLLGDVVRSFPSLTIEECHGFVVNQFRDIIGSPALRERYGYPSVEEIRADLAGKDLACWCALDQPCHADVLLEIANGRPRMTTDNPESIRCPECHAMADQPCHGLNQMITVGGVTRRAVHAGRYAAHLPPGERAAYWRAAVQQYYAEELRNHEGATT